MSKRSLQTFRITRGNDMFPAGSTITISDVYVPNRRDRTVGRIRGLWCRTARIRCYFWRLGLALVGRDLPEVME